MEIKSRLNSENSSHHVVKNLLSSHLMSKNVNILIYEYRLIIILSVVLYGCEAWYLELRDECRLREFKSRVARKIFGTKRDEVAGSWRK